MIRNRKPSNILHITNTNRQRTSMLPPFNLIYPINRLNIPSITCETIKSISRNSYNLPSSQSFNCFIRINLCCWSNNPRNTFNTLFAFIRTPGHFSC
ncbi:hypothetical protein HanHA300_Chr01g0025591 [Helianthus annuus]|nr:hypothetical protein HanHA300_Chr01g0025591 [Helianthus annuus]KAJ0627606.1 hypothetical protein HanHA89_Chr01g0027681 [Helianthus annuus]KAJ0783906.1 hypothetical protein HanLR1_Chr01g0026271 [Helianthus annuus]